MLLDEYYVCSFVAGLQDYVQNHLQCHRPRNLIEAIWMARRIEQSHPLRNRTYASFNRNDYTSFNRNDYTNSRDKRRMNANPGARSYKPEKDTRVKGTA